ncbi:DUF1257 domain-containing protein [Planktothrix sp. FACHB-1355]|uniref:DUF1257 domain-containing protein n=1 Tax=Aerosakkonema funiforme FACHB-1375 TaxID=2949571 RepID=A0A926VA40_9CYAN|nr:MULTISPECIES: DUF1257 domain-containing protein [Oscillatoriales]MBD2180017.1 DUF1257 domain-containing protein [Aerosakkonema funiforme FACHB-1375]MBD3559924.1 DUF1257 domain-containing protein [Planktothrix sp. FACHB-1355]
MSHFTAIKTELRDVNALVMALEDLGFKDKVEIHAEAQRLYGFEGDLRQETAEVVIRRQHLGAASNDIGFKQQDDGTYEAVISSYDRAYKYSQQWLNKLTQRYGYHQLMATVPEQGFTVEEEETLEDGTIRVLVARWV